MMIFPKNPRSAVYVVARLICDFGPMNAAKAIELLAPGGHGTFSDRTIRSACWQMKREFMADEDGGVYTVRAHIVKFFADQVKAEAGQAAPIVQPRAINFMAAPALKRNPAHARPIRPGADDYKSWPSRVDPLPKAANKYAKDADQ